MNLGKNFLGQATLEYVAITLALAVIVFLGFMLSNPGAHDGGVGPGRGYNFVETSRSSLDKFITQAEKRIESTDTNRFPDH